MGRAYRTLPLAAAVALALGPGRAPAADWPVPVEGRSLTLRAAPGAAAARFAFAASWPAGISLAPDPETGGARLILLATAANGSAEVVRVDLDAARWRRRGRRLSYRDPTGRAGGVRSVLYRQGRGGAVLRVRAGGSRWPWRPTQAQRRVRVLLRLGREWICADFGGAIRRSGAGRISARRAGPPPSCPAICDGDLCTGPGDVASQPLLGEQRMLFLRVLYDGDPGPIVSRADARLLADGLARTISENSYRRAALRIDVTPPLALGRAEGFQGPGSIALIREAAVAAAEAAGFDLSRYSRELIFSRRLWDGATGQGSFNMRTSLAACRAACVYLVAHELGHSLGWSHADFWWTGGGSPIAPTGRDIGYGDGFDIMGDQIRGRPPRSFHHFHPWLKRRAGWLREADVHTLTGSGSWTLRPLARAARGSAGEFTALRIPTDRRRGRWKGDYWIFFRADEPLAAGGAVVSWGYESNTRRTRLLDMTPGSLPAGTPEPARDWEDAVLTPGHVFRDPEAGFELEVLDVGPAGIRVEVRVEPGVDLASVDRSPLLDFLSPRIGETLRASSIYEVTAYDPDAGSGNGAGIESVRLELHRMSDAVIEPLVRGEPPPPGAIVTAEPTAPPYRLVLADPLPPTGVYALVATAFASDGGSSTVWLQHLIEGP